MANSGALSFTSRTLINTGTLVCRDVPEGEKQVSVSNDSVFYIYYNYLLYSAGAVVLAM